MDTVLTSRVWPAMKIRRSIWRAFSLGILLSLYSPSQAVTSTTNGLVLHYTFDRAEEDVITDHSGRENHGANYGARFHPEGIRGGSFEFDGRTSYIAVPASESLHVRDLTVSVFFYVYAYQDQLPLVSWINRAETPFGRGSQVWSHVHGYQWRGFGTGTHLIGADRREHVLDRVLSFANPPPRQWHHMMVTYDHTTGVAQLYINGTNVERRRIGSYDLFTDGDVMIGAGFIDLTTNPRPYFYGRMDDLRIYNRALSEADLATILRDGTVQIASLKRDTDKVISGDSPVRPDPPARPPTFSPSTIANHFDLSARDRQTDTMLSQRSLPHHVVYIGFSNDPEGDEDVTHFYRHETLFIRVHDVSLDGFDTDAGVRIVMYQHPLPPMEWDLEHLEGGWYTGNTTLQNFRPGRVYTAVIGWNEFGVTLRKDVELYIEP